ncbi:MAG: hypothetical protein N2450_01125 [bacterium]|nr:hypothetical protein [bacterium]
MHLQVKFILTILIPLCYLQSIFAAYEWQTGFPLERVLNCSESMKYSEIMDTTGWKCGVMVSNPYGIKEITYTELIVAKWKVPYAVKIHFTQLGLDGYRESRLGVFGSYELKRFWYAFGGYFGWIDVPPLSKKYGTSIYSELGWGTHTIHSYLVCNQAMKSRNQSFVLPEKQMMVIQYQPLQTWILSGSAQYLYQEIQYAVGGIWKPFEEVSVYMGTNFTRGWGAGISISFQGFSIAFSSVFNESLGWSSFWSSQVASVKTKQVGYKHPPTIP